MLDHFKTSWLSGLFTCFNKFIPIYWVIYCPYSSYTHKICIEIKFLPFRCCQSSSISIPFNIKFSQTLKRLLIKMIFKNKNSLIFYPWILTILNQVAQLIFLYIFILQSSSVVCKQVRQSVHNIPWHLNADAIIVQVTYYILAHR